jgi:tetratricopeptide (TPR) repeat protein
MRVVPLLVIIIILGVIGWVAHTQGWLAKGQEAVAGSFDAHFAKGNSLFNSERYDDAIAEFQKAYELDPEDNNAPSALKRIADCYREAGDGAQAIEYYQKCIDEYPKWRGSGKVRQDIEKTRALGGF